MYRQVVEEMGWLATDLYMWVVFTLDQLDLIQNLTALLSAITDTHGLCRPRFLYKLTAAS
jgi:hypothetical protein